MRACRARSRIPTFRVPTLIMVSKTKIKTCSLKEEKLTKRRLSARIHNHQIKIKHQRCKKRSIKRRKTALLTMALMTKVRPSQSPSNQVMMCKDSSIKLLWLCATQLSKCYKSRYSQRKSSRAYLLMIWRLWKQSKQNEGWSIKISIGTSRRCFPSSSSLCTGSAGLPAFSSSRKQPIMSKCSVFNAHSS